MKYSVVGHTVVNNTSEHLQVSELNFHYNYRDAECLMVYVYKLLSALEQERN